MRTRIRILAVSTLLVASIAFGQANPGPGNPAPIPEFAELKPVPHGELRVVWYDSKSLGVQRRMHVYLPPGYDRSRGRFPVLYLIHGGGQDDTAWPSGGRAGFILDNLIASGTVKPMIVVMPNGGGTDAAMNRPGNDNSPAGTATRVSNSNQTRDGFLRDLIADIIPRVDSSYHVQSGRESRAIAVFSFGGAESLWAGTEHLDKFAWVGVFSMGIQGGSNAGAGAIAGSGSAGAPDEFVKEHAAFFADTQQTNKQLRLFWIGVGKEDGVVANGPKQLADTLADHEIRHEYHETEGGHTMSNWQAYLRDFTALLFR
jgi:enterochelin esterase family protein